MAQLGPCPQRERMSEEWTHLQKMTIRVTLHSVQTLEERNILRLGVRMKFVLSPLDLSQPTLSEPWINSSQHGTYCFSPHDNMIRGGGGAMSKRGEKPTFKRAD